MTKSSQPPDPTATDMTLLQSSFTANQPHYDQQAEVVKACDNLTDRILIMRAALVADQLRSLVNDARRR